MVLQWLCQLTLKVIWRTINYRHPNRSVGSAPSSSSTVAVKAHCPVRSHPQRTNKILSTNAAVARQIEFNVQHLCVATVLLTVYALIKFVAALGKRRAYN